MRYVSTRGEAPELSFEDALLAGLARDGGLYVPKAWPQLTCAAIAGFAGKPYAEVAVDLLEPFAGGAIARPELLALARDAYARFDHRAVTPLVQIDRNLWVLELFHGPTLAFKDLAMQFLARLMDHVLAARGERVTIVAATSGDTGGAAIEAFRGSARVDVVVLFPQGRISEVQRRMMTTAAERLAIASNENDILTRAWSTGNYTLGEVVATTSPSMDIQVSSNFERFLFEGAGRDPAFVRAKMGALAQSRSIGLGEAMVPFRQNFIAERVDQAAVADCIRRVKAESGYLLDPHSACAVVAARKVMTNQSRHIPHVALATAHPAKFPDTMEAITGSRPALPPRLASLMGDRERASVLRNDLGAVQRFVEDRAGRRSAKSRAGVAA